MKLDYKSNTIRRERTNERKANRVSLEQGFSFWESAVKKEKSQRLKICLFGQGSDDFYLIMT